MKEFIQLYFLQIISMIKMCSLSKLHFTNYDYIRKNDINYTAINF